MKVGSDIPGSEHTTNFSHSLTFPRGLTWGWQHRWEWDLFIWYMNIHTLLRKIGYPLNLAKITILTITSLHIWQKEPAKLKTFPSVLGQLWDQLSMAALDVDKYGYSPGEAQSGLHFHHFLLIHLIQKWACGTERPMQQFAHLSLNMSHPQIFTTLSYGTVQMSEYNFTVVVKQEVSYTDGNSYFKVETFWHESQKEKENRVNFGAILLFFHVGFLLQSLRLLFNKISN